MLGLLPLSPEEEGEEVKVKLKKEFERSPMKTDPDVIFNNVHVPTQIFNDYLHEVFPFFTITSFILTSDLSPLECV